uniref:Uncharacterized protein n=1 Tax=Phytophthora fragariae TaxID=53985 RepID=A0A6A3E7Y9_9STRA|nr:hypothetical protein PF009_g20097 [Phytophthora fragariae]
MFYTDRGCTSKHKSWPAKTQSGGKLHFPKDFKADRINDAISSFMVVKEGNADNEEYVCSESGAYVPFNASVNNE